MHQAIMDFVLDLSQNSWEAGADLIELELVQTTDRLDVRIRDNGRGMDGQEQLRALDPFYTDGVKHPHRRVGLGLPFLQQTMECLGSKLVLMSQKGQGTTLIFSFPLKHIDCPPMGDVAGTLAMTFCFAGNYELVLRRQKSDGSYKVSRSELLAALGDLDSVGSTALLREYLESMEEDHGENEP
jgi:hypothetical protein